MRKIKKLTALMLAVVMVLAMSLTAFATENKPVATPKDGGDFSITLTGKQGGHQYAAYQVFKGDLLEKENGENILSNIEWGAGVVTEKGEKSIIAALKALKVGEQTPFSELADNATAKDVAEVLNNAADDSALAQAFADVVGEFLANNTGISNNPPTELSNGEFQYVIPNLKAGYYLVKDSGDVAEEGDAYTRYIMQVVADVDATVKSEVPDIEKKIVEGNNKVDANNAGVGKVVSFEITGNVPDYTGYDKYFYVINDTLSAGLTFNNDITVKIGGEELIKGTDYYVYTGGDADGHTFQIAFKDIKEYAKETAIVVNYSATVNSNAVIGNTGNPNTATLIYSNNPNSKENGESEPGKPDDNVPTGEGPEKKTLTFVTEIDITKTANDEKTPLAGAEFTLTGTSTQTVLAGGTYYLEAENGDYYLLKDGTYTKRVPQADVKDEDGNVTTKGNEDYYVSTTIKYSQQTTTTTQQITTNVKMVAVSDENGKITFTGLGAGTYTLEETVVPDGYNKADNKTIVITCTPPSEVISGNETAKWTWTVDEEEAQTVPTYATTIVNKSGSLLPSTGGIGTTIFYIVGAILVIGAGVILVVKKRMSNE